MDSITRSKAAPSLLLLNEIEILSAQSRLLELYIKQAQTTGISEVTRLGDRYEAELAAARRELQKAAHELEHRSSSAGQAAESLRAEIRLRETQLVEKQAMLDRYNAALENARSENAALVQRLGEIEAANEQMQSVASIHAGIQERHEAQLAELEKQLEDKELRLHERENATAELVKAHDNQTRDLETRLSAQRTYSEGREQENRELQESIASLQAQVAQLESGRKVQASALREVEQTRHRFDGELADLHKQIEQKDHALQERDQAIQLSEQRLNTELQHLGNQLAETRNALEERNDEIKRLDSMLEQSREQFQSELTALSAELKRKEQALQERQTAIDGLERTYKSRFNDLQVQLAEKHAALESRTVTLETLQSELATARARAGELEAEKQRADTAARETAERLGNEFRGELAPLRRELEDKESKLQEQRQIVAALEDRHRAETYDLQAQLAEKQTALENRREEADKLEWTLADARQRLVQLESQMRRAEAAATLQAEEARREYETELKNLQKALEHKNSALREHEATISGMEQTLRGRIDDLQKQLAEQHALLENRNDELVTVKNEKDALMEQLAQWESGGGQGRTTSAGKPESNYRTELNDLSDARRSETKDSPDSLPEKEQPLESGGGDFLLGKPSMTEAQKERYKKLQELLESINPKDDAGGAASSRWRSGWSRKRRWKS